MTKMHRNEAMLSGGPADNVVCLDLALLNSPLEGRDDFFWPISQAEMHQFRDSIQFALPPLAYGIRQWGSEEARFLSIFAHLLARECIAIFQAVTLLHRTRRLVSPTTSRILAPLMEGRQPRFPHFLPYLLVGPPQRSRWLDPARAVRAALVGKSGIGRSGFFGPRFQTDIIVCSSSPLIEMHARQVSDSVVYLPLRDWFKPVDPALAEKGRRQAMESASVNDTLDTCVSIFKSHGIALDKAVTDYLRLFLAELAMITKLRLAELLDSPDRLPKRLWSGTGGSPLIRILQQAVRINGGVATGHDHAYGLGMWANNGMAEIEFEECDVFVTFSPAQVQGYIEVTDPRRLIRRDLPKIVSIQPNDASERQPAAAHLRRDKVPKKIVYVMKSYFGDENSIMPVTPDVVVVDWQARLLAKLRDWGYDVWLKPHPECTVPVPDMLLELTGRQPLNGKFEDLHEKFDAVIFDNPCTTTFGEALLSECGIVLVDFGAPPPRAQVRPLLAQRCRVVPGSIDRSNRRRVDWDQLLQAIKQSREFSYSPLVDEYLPWGLSRVPRQSNQH